MELRKRTIDNMWRASTHVFLLKMMVSYVPSEKLLIASFEGESDMNFKVTLGSPSRIIKWTMINPLNTMVHVESRSR